MNIGKSIYSLLSNASAVTTITSTRIYPNRISQVKDYPAISYMQLATVPTNQKDSTGGYLQSDFDIDCFSKDYTQLNTLSTAVRTALDKKNISSQGDNIVDIRFQNEFEGYNDEAEVFQKTLQFRFINVIT